MPNRNARSESSLADSGEGGIKKRKLMEMAIETTHDVNYKSSSSVAGQHSSKGSTKSGAVKKISTTSSKQSKSKPKSKDVPKSLTKKIKKATTTKRTTSPPAKIVIKKTMAAKVAPRKMAASMVPKKAKDATTKCPSKKIPKATKGRPPTTIKKKTSQLVQKEAPTKKKKAAVSSSSTSSSRSANKKVASKKVNKDKSSGKKFGFWRGGDSRRHRRMASLNAQAKVHILYENEARSPVDQSGSAQQQDSDAGGIAGRSSPPAEQVTRNRKNNDTKTGKMAAVKKRKAPPMDDVRFQISAPKRMASLNAQAILAASYSLDRFRKEKVVQVTALPPPLPHPPSPPVVETVTSAETTTTSVASSPDQDDPVDTIMQVINAVACRGFDEDDCCAAPARPKKKVSRTSNKDMDNNHASVSKRPSKKSCSMTSAVGVTPPPPPTVVAPPPPPPPPRPKSCDHDQTEPLNLMRTKSPSAVVCSEPTTPRHADASGGIVVVPVEPVDLCSLLVVDEAPSFVSSQTVGTTTFDMDNQNDYQKVMSPPTSVGFLPVKDLHHHSLESGNKVVEVKTEAIRRDKIEDTAEVTITGMYINPVTNTSQSFCISRIHTYKQATSTHSCYSPPNAASVIDLHQAQPQPQPPQPQPALLTSSSVAASGGQLLHGGHMGLHHSGEGHVYPYATAAAAASANQAPPPAAPPGGMDAAGGISRHYGSAFTVPHYGHHQPLPYGYYQPAGPMIQTLTTTATADPSSCLIHKPVPFHASGHPFAGSLSGSGQQQQQSSNSGQQQQQQPFPVDQCRPHPTAPAYPPPGPGPGPGRQQQVYAGGGGGVVISGATAARAAPPSSALSSPPPPPSGAPGPPPPPPSASAAACGAPSTVGGAATAATAADSQSASGNVARAAPPPPSELYFADSCQSCCAAAAAAAAAVHASSSSSPVQRQHEQQRQRSGGQHYARPSRGSPSSAPPPPSPSASATAAVATRFHRLPPSAMSNKGGGGIDQQDANGYHKALAALPLQSQTKAVKMESSSAGADVAADLQDGYANPAIAAAAKTPSNSGRNGRQQLHLHRNKSSPPSADVVSVATSNGQRMAHIGHATPKEARLTVSLEDVLRKTSSSSSSSSGTTTATMAVQWTQQQRQLHVDVGLRRPPHNEDDEDDSEEERRSRLSTHNGGLLTRSKTLELARTNADCVMKTRSGANGITAAAKRSSECCRSKNGIRDVTNERRPSSSASMMTKLEERTRNGYKRNNQLLLSPTTRRNNNNNGTFSLLMPPSPSPQLSPTTRSSRSTATSKGPSVRRLSVPCLKWNSSSSQSQSSSSTSLDSMAVMTTQNHAPKISRVAKKVLRYSNGWTWEGSPSKKAVYLTNDDPPVIRWCYSSMRHEQGDVIRARDCILLKSGPRKADLPYVAKVAALWENPEDGEMMVSMLWYYRPEHTEQGRRPHHMVDEIFASKHRDVNSVACIEDKCHVLTFNEYCRYKCRIRILEQGTRPNLSLVADLEDGYPRKERQPPGRIASDLVFFCRKVYDFRQKRILKNPS